MLGLAILCLVFVVMFTIAAIIIFNEGSLIGAIIAALAAIALGAATIWLANASGHGHLLGPTDLKINEVYETLGAIPEVIDEVLYVNYVTLRERDGDIRAFQLRRQLPPIFKVIRVSPDSVLYRPYPTPEN